MDGWATITAPEQIGTFDYPAVVAVNCDEMHLTWTVDHPHLFPIALQTLSTTMSFGHSNVPGSVATIQHLRNVGPGYTSGFPLGGLLLTVPPSGLHP